jgi:hypothetical protein
MRIFVQTMAVLCTIAFVIRLRWLAIGYFPSPDATSAAFDAFYFAASVGWAIYLLSKKN